MLDPNVTPEERLLRLIESGEKGELEPKATRKPVFWDVRTWATVLFPRRVKANGSARVGFGAGFLPRELSPSLINRSLLVLLIFLGAGIAFDFSMNGVQTSLKDLPAQVAPLRPPVEEEQALVSLRPLPEYLKEVEERDIFSPSLFSKPKQKLKPLPTKQPPVKPPQPGPLQILQGKAQNLKLVGISWGEVPMAMIEETTKRETSFLKAGQFINEIQIKAILKDRVVLAYKGAEYDLF